MPKNFSGGKNFKKGRKVVGDVVETRFDDLEEGQDLARVTKMLGNRRVLCFCGSDGMERVCKIRGVLCKGPKKQRIEIGDIVLVSSRDYSLDDSSDEEGGAVISHAKVAEGGAVTASGKRDIYDLITKLASSQIRDARRKVTGMHQNLFEVSGAHRPDAADGSFEFGYDSEEDESKATPEAESNVVDKRDKVRHRRNPVVFGIAEEGEGEGADVDVDGI
jgi:initiation factor 1A